MAQTVPFLAVDRFLHTKPPAAEKEQLPDPRGKAALSVGGKPVNPLDLWHRARFHTLRETFAESNSVSASQSMQ